MQNKLLLPLAVVVAGGLIAGALFFGGNNNKKENNTADNNPSGKINPITENDHIFGSKDAPIKLVEYSDPNCRYCRAFHPTMKKIMSDFADSGKVAWIYRHFAILGPESVTQAHATECAAELGGPAGSQSNNEMFWRYLDNLFESKDESAQLLPGKTVESIAGEVGLDKEQFLACQESGRYIKKINDLRQDATNAGAQGTPYTVVLGNNEILTVIPGALPYENVRQMIEQVLEII